MEQERIVKQIIGFYKTTFDSSFNAMTILQEQSEKMMQTALDQSPWIPEEGRKIVGEWMKAYRQGRDDFRSAVDESYGKVESFFSSKTWQDVAQEAQKARKTK
ncbi:MAG: hypothetical protein HPY65_18560 [Syntrophaceae bacterium]|nr:hypothetical protein [Syntrophaceae bacterium]